MRNNSKEILLQSALDLFSEKGYDSVGVSEIVERAGVTKPTLYYFFKSKEGIFKEILNKEYKIFNKKIEKKAIYIPNSNSYYDDVYPVLLKVVEEYFDFALANKTFFVMMLSMIFAPPTSQTSEIIKPYNLKQYGIIKQLFKEISKNHTNLKNKEEQYAYSFIAMINACITVWYYGSGNLDEEKAKTIVHQFMHGVFV